MVTDRMLRPLLASLALLTSTVALAQEAPPPPPAPTEPAPALPSTTEPAPPATPEPPPASSTDPAEAPTGDASPTPTAPAPATTEPAKPEAPAPPAAPAATEPATTEPVKPERRVGDPIPLTRREPTLPGLGFMVGLRYGLVGTGPTRFVNDIRFGITDAIEIRTALLPFPSSLMVRGRVGSQQSELGAFLIDAGLAHWDAGLRIVPDTGEPKVGTRLHWEVGGGWIKAFGDRVSVRAHARYRYRLSFLDDDDQHAVAVDSHVTYDLLDSLAVSAGLGYAQTIGPVRELSVGFVETDAPGMSHLLARDEGGTQSVTIPLTMTYGRVESFDVDLFCTPRVWPEPGIVFGAGLRFRFEPFSS